MAELVELSFEAHGDLKLDTQAATEIAKKTHIMSLRVTEINRAACEVPVFLTQLSPDKDDRWMISTMTSLEVEKNLLVRDGKWQGIFQPTSMITYPFSLMLHPTEEKKYTIGIDPEHAAFSKEDGEPLFEDSHKAGVRLSHITQMLQDDMHNDMQTFHFAKHMNELGLIKSVDVVVTYQNGSVNTLKGLNTIDEVKLSELSEEQFKELREKHYLAPIYSLLTSPYQLNRLIQLHNEHSTGEKIAQVSMGVEKDQNAAA